MAQHQLVRNSVVIIISTFGFSFLSFSFSFLFCRYCPENLMFVDKVDQSWRGLFLKEVSAAETVALAKGSFVSFVCLRFSVVLFVAFLCCFVCCVSLLCKILCCFYENVVFPFRCVSFGSFFLFSLKKAGCFKKKKKKKKSFFVAFLFVENKVFGFLFF